MKKEYDDADVKVLMEKIVEMLNAALSGTSEDAKKAKKEFERKRNDVRGWRFGAKDLETVKNLFERYETADTKHKTYFIGTLKNIVWHFPKKESVFLTDFIVRNITHKDGGVRQAIVNFFDWFRIDDNVSFKENAPIGENYHSFLLAIKKLIRDHQPEDIIISDNREDFPTYLNDLKPSVYKSLLLVWEKATCGQYMEDKLKKYPELQIAVPKRNWDDDDWLSENEVYADEEALNLWVGQKIGSDVYSALFVLESLARSRFVKELDDAGFEKNFYEKLIADMEKHPAMEGEDVRSYEELIAECIRIGFPHEYSDPLIRGFLAFSNHRIIKNEEGEPLSPILLSAIMERESLGRHEPKDIKAFLFRVRDAHLAIDAFCEQSIQNDSVSTKEMIERLEKYVPQNQFAKEKEIFETSHEHHVELFRRYASIAHHSFDWYVLSAPWGVLGKTPEKLAALSYFVVKKANEERKPYCAVNYTNKDLSEFGKWAGNAVSGSANGFFYDVMNGLRDPELLYVKKGGSEKEIEK
jgi:hypothetical protein